MPTSPPWKIPEIFVVPPVALTYRPTFVSDAPLHAPVDVISVPYLLIEAVEVVAVFVRRFPIYVPALAPEATVCNSDVGAAVPTPRLPAAVSRIPSTLFVLATRSILSVVPQKLVPATVPAFPKSSQPVPKKGTQATPL